MPAVVTFIEQRLVRQDSVLILATDSAGQGLGFVQMYPQLSSLDMDEFMVINDLYVTQHARCVGLGRRLMEQAIAIAKQRGYQRLSLETESVNTKAQSLYESLGFRRDSHYYQYQLLME
ncbi:GNAT family N-acetyltransferase [Shewanella sp. NIFS-20-20]|nr:GNAT family N-acetyltransferase [Shewanella sp. NIFS-20-20]